MPQIANSRDRVSQQKHDEDRRWHSLPPQKVMDLLGTGPGGLHGAAIEEKRRVHGHNEMSGKKKDGLLKAVFHQIHQLLIYILLLAAVVTALLDHWIDTVVILAVVLANVIIGFVQERKAGRAIDALDKLVVSECTVVRDGKRSVIPSREAVPGDIVLMESGDKVPADMRLIYSKGLQIDEAILTGESVPSEKRVEALPGGKLAAADMNNMAFAGTLVTYGKGRGIVVSTGNHTQISRISACMREAEETMTPLQKKISSFAVYLSGAVAVLAILTFVGGLLSGQEPVFIFLASVSIAVAAIPEGLPALVTIAMALSVRTMAARKAIIRNLPSVETLGSTTVICSDKTGTLTMNQMTVTNILAGGRNYKVTGNGYSVVGQFLRDGEVVEPREEEALARTLAAGAVCNDALLKGDDDIIGDPTEGALIVSAAKCGLDLHLPRLDEIPFESETQYMATLDKKGERRFIYLKGSAERVLDMCDRQMDRHGNPVEMDLDSIMQTANDMASSALRVIAFAEKEMPPDAETIDKDDMSGFVFLGLQGMIDPPRPEVVEAIGRCQDASIKVVMITGDHAVTARAIAMKLGISDGTVDIVTGKMLEEMSDEELFGIVGQTPVYARASPIHKYRIVRQLQKHQEVVAVTGDGVNDAPALKVADIGVSMGIMGTDVTKEASDMILADDNFATIVNAVEEGRHMYNNLQKMLTFLIPTSIGQASVITVAILAGLAIPLMPVHVLWINLVTSVTCTLPLALEAKEPGILRRPPRRPGSPLISKRMLARVFFVSGIMMLGAFIAFYTSLSTGSSEEAARTAAMSAIVIMEVVYIFSSRSLTEPAVGRGFLGNPWVFVGAGITVLLQLGVVYLSPMRTLFSTEPLSVIAWTSILAMAAALFVVVELEKVTMRRYNRHMHHNGGEQ